MDAQGLTRFDLFTTLTEAQRTTLAGCLVRKELAAGEKLFAEGDPGDSLFLLSEGQVRISKMIDGVGEEALAVLKPGAYFGEMSLVDSLPRSADALADSAAVVYSLSQDDFSALVDSDAQATVGLLSAMVRTMAGRLRETNDQVKAMHLMSMW
jgi:CRP-like cAMP-binding protein